MGLLELSLVLIVLSVPLLLWWVSHTWVDKEPLRREVGECTDRSPSPWLQRTDGANPTPPIEGAGNTYIQRPSSLPESSTPDHEILRPSEESSEAPVPEKRNRAWLESPPDYDGESAQRLSPKQVTVRSASMATMQGRSRFLPSQPQSTCPLSDSGNNGVPQQTRNRGRSMGSLPTSLPPPPAVHPENFWKHWSEQERLRKSTTTQMTDVSAFSVNSQARSASIESVPTSDPSRISSLRSTSVESGRVSVRQLERTAETLRRLAGKAVAIINNTPSQVLNEWYGDLDLNLVQVIANNEHDPILAMSKDNRIREIPSHLDGIIGDFLNLGLSLHHFSAAANCESIEKYGLLSLRSARRMGIVPTHVSSEYSRRSDSMKGIDKFVHLSFTDNPAMLYNVRARYGGEIASYRVSPVVLLDERTRFCRNYANKSGATILSVCELTALDMIALYIGFNRLKYWQVMVQGQVKTNQTKRDRDFDHLTVVV